MEEGGFGEGAIARSRQDVAGPGLRSRSWRCLEARPRACTGAVDICSEEAGKPGFPAGVVATGRAGRGPSGCSHPREQGGLGRSFSPGPRNAYSSPTGRVFACVSNKRQWAQGPGTSCSLRMAKGHRKALLRSRPCPERLLCAFTHSLAHRPHLLGVLPCAACGPHHGACPALSRQG